MRLALDRLYEAVTQLDKDIRKQKKQAATCGAMRELERLERAREHAFQGQMILVRLENASARAGCLDASSTSTG